MPEQPWQTALAQVMDRTHHELFRARCADKHPNHDAWRAAVLKIAGSLQPPVPMDPAKVAEMRAAIKAGTYKQVSAAATPDVDVHAALRAIADLPPGATRKDPRSCC